MLKHSNWEIWKTGMKKFQKKHLCYWKVVLDLERCTRARKRWLSYHLLIWRSTGCKGKNTCCTAFPLISTYSHSLHSKKIHQRGKNMRFLTTAKATAEVCRPHRLLLLWVGVRARVHLLPAEGEQRPPELSLPAGEQTPAGKGSKFPATHLERCVGAHPCTTSLP